MRQLPTKTFANQVDYYSHFIKAFTNKLRPIILIFFFLHLSIGAFAQNCLSGAIIFSTQQQIDDFPTNYPGCSNIQGDVNINESVMNNITNLNGLSQLTSIGGGLWIYDNDTLSSLTGLQNITSIGGSLWIYDNDTLSSLLGLQNITSIGGYLAIGKNTALGSLTALNNLTTIGGNLEIYKNDTLSSLAGLQNVTSIGGDLAIIDNPVLNSITGLQNITSIFGGSLTIRDNPALSSLTGLSNLTSIATYLSISSNAALSSLTVLNNLTTIGGGLSIGDNPALSSLAGLQSLTSIGGDLAIVANPALSTLAGLQNLTSIAGDLSIINNDALSSLSGLDNIDPNSISSNDPIYKDINIHSNALLSSCDVLSICLALSNPATTTDIHDNAANCNTEVQIESECQAGFITTWEVTAGDLDITIPTDSANYTYNYNVDWGDGNTTSGASGDTTHTYAAAGTYTVEITGTFPAIYFWASTNQNQDKIKTIQHWGTNEWKSMKTAFYGCSNLTYTATGIPNLNQTSDISNMFNFAISFNGDISNWNVSKVTKMVGLFANTHSFNQPLNWNVDSVTDMWGMFWGATSFNQDLSNWNVDSVTDMSNMFQNATSFNQDLNNWNVSKVTSMMDMFRNATSFNQDLNWDVSKVTDMSYMFDNATSFNGNISNWNVPKVANMSHMFDNATSFNGDISNWNVSKATNMSYMFYNATSFNGNISNWNVHKVYDMSSMFRDATSFDGDISNWNVSKATNMYAMFANANSFDQNLGAWDVDSVSNMDFMLDSCGISIINYDSTLIGWASQAVKPNVTLKASTLKYCNGEAARNILTSNPNNWTITGDIKECPPCHSDSIAYVNILAVGNNDGNSWTDAFTDLQDAVLLASSCNKVLEIWVKKGTYLPHPTDINAYFELQQGITIYGGFPSAGNPTMADRDWANNPTILSGDINVQGSTADNSYHVVFCPSGVDTSVLDGFTISDAKANGAGSDGIGAGLWCSGSGAGQNASPSIRNCIFTNLYAKKGAAVFNDGSLGGESSTVFDSCTFINNAGISGTVYNNGEQGVSNPKFNNCTFINNQMTGSGGAVYNNSQNGGEVEAEFESTSFLGNTSILDGGAVYNDGGNTGNCQSAFEYCIFKENQAGNNAGAIYSKGGDGICITSGNACLFQLNSAENGGALYNEAFFGDVTASFYNTIFKSNTSFVTGVMTGNGGAVYNDGTKKGSVQNTCDAEFVNCDFTDNFAQDSGGAIYNIGSGSGSLGEVNCIAKNCYFDGDTAATFGFEIFNIDVNNVGYDHCAFKEYYFDCIDLESNSGGEPITCNQNIYSDKFISLNEVSPLIDAGVNIHNPNFFDYYGNTRKIDGDFDAINTIDIGAAEHETVVFSPTANTCDTSLYYTESMGMGNWQYLGDEVETSGASPIKVVRYKMAINDNGNALGKVWVKLLRNTNPIRFQNGTPYLDRNWKITPEIPLPPGGFASASLRFYFTKEEFDALKAADNAVSQLSDLEVTKYDGANQDCSFANNSSDTADYDQIAFSSTQIYAGGEIYVVEFDVTSFSEFYISRANTSLPIELTTFTANRLNDQKVLLDWKTSSETNNKGFEIYRQLDTEDEFSFVGQVESIGDRTSTTSYDFIDQNAHSGISYYRLKQIDIDGKHEWSTIVAVKANHKNDAIAVYPNPFTDKLTIVTSKEGFTYRVIDLLGTEVMSGKAAASNELNLSNLAEGTYYIILQDDSAQILYTDKLIKLRN